MGFWDCRLVCWKKKAEQNRIITKKKNYVLCVNSSYQVPKQYSISLVDRGDLCTLSVQLLGTNYFTDLMP